MGVLRITRRDILYIPHELRMGQTHKKQQMYTELSLWHLTGGTYKPGFTVLLVYYSIVRYHTI